MPPCPPPTICAHSNVSKPDSTGCCHAGRGLLYSGFTCVNQNHHRPHVLRLLLEHAPEIARQKNWRGYLLLHQAMRAKVHVDGFELVLYAYPNAIVEKCVHGSTPLHLTCQYRASVETMELLVLSRHSGAASISGGPDGNLPIHVAIKNLDEHVIILALLDSFPGAAPAQACNHEAAASSHSMSTRRFFVRANKATG